MFRITDMDSALIDFWEAALRARRSRDGAKAWGFPQSAWFECNLLYKYKNNSVQLKSNRHFSLHHLSRYTSEPKTNLCLKRFVEGGGGVDEWS